MLGPLGEIVTDAIRHGEQAGHACAPRQDHDLVFAVPYERTGNTRSGCVLSSQVQVEIILLEIRPPFRLSPSSPPTHAVSVAITYLFQRNSRVQS